MTQHDPHYVGTTEGQSEVKFIRKKRNEQKRGRRLLKQIQPVITDGMVEIVN